MIDLPRLKRAFDKFWFESPSRFALPFLRVGLSALLLLQMLQLVPHLFELYGEYGMIQEKLSAYLGTPWIPRIGWFSHLLGFTGLGFNSVTSLLFGLYFVSLVFWPWAFSRESLQSWYGFFTSQYLIAIT